MHIQYTLQQIFSAHCNKSSVHLQCTHTAAVITSSVTIQYTHTAAAITSSVHTAAAIISSVHTAAILSSVHCSYIIQCTLQQIFSAHCSYTIQCTLQLHYLVPILHSTFSAPLNHHRVSLYHYWPTSRTVSRH